MANTYMKLISEREHVSFHYARKKDYKKMHDDGQWHRTDDPHKDFLSYVPSNPGYWPAQNVEGR